MKKQILAVAALCGVMSSSVMAVEVTGNAGFVSEYLFRGIPQTDGNAAAQGGIDAAWDEGWYAGTWGSSVDNGTDNGVEIDLYGGWGGSTGDFNYSAGGTYYTYTDSVDEDYAEINLSGGWKWFTLDIAVGEYDVDPTRDYEFYSLTAELDGFYGKVGTFENDFDGSYFEAGYGATLTVADTDLFDYSISYIYSDKDLLGGESGNTLIFGIVKNFEIFKN